MCRPPRQTSVASGIVGYLYRRSDRSARSPSPLRHSFVRWLGRPGLYALSPLFQRLQTSAHCSASGAKVTHRRVGFMPRFQTPRYRCSTASYNAKQMDISSLFSSALFHHFNDDEAVSISFCPTPEPLLVVQSTSLLLYLILHCPSVSSVVFLGFLFY